jgi:hypothetical protein
LERPFPSWIERLVDGDPDTAAEAAAELESVRYLGAWSPVCGIVSHAVPDWISY